MQKLFFNVGSVDSVRNCHGDKTDRIRFIEISKGIGLFLVISSHVYGPLMSWSFPFYIPLFFVVSGFCTIRPVSLKNKFKKLIIPYFLFSAILLSIYRSIHLFDIIGVLYSRWCLYPLGCDGNIFLLQSGNGPLWFLTSMYVSFILYWLLQKSNRVLLLLFLYFSITYCLAYLPLLLPWSLDTAFLMAMFIFVGTEFRKRNILQYIDKKWVFFFSIIYLVFIHYCGFVNLSVRIYGRSLFILFPAALLGSVLILKMSLLIEKFFVGKVLSSIGRHSLSIFCLHIPFISVWNTLIDFFHFTMPLYVNGILCVLFIMTITYLLSLILDKYVLQYII